LVKHTVDETEGNATGYACLRITNYHPQMMEEVLRRYFFTGNRLAHTCHDAAARTRVIRDRL